VWLLQGNPDKFRIDDYLRDAANKDREIYWTVTKQQNEIRVGDFVAIWRASGKSKVTPGIVAIGEVVDAPKLLVDNLGEYWTETIDATEAPRARIRLKGVRLSEIDGMITKEVISQFQYSKDLEILKMANKTVFRLSPDQGEELVDAWQAFNELTSHGNGYFEGGLLLALHLRRERSRALVDLAFKQLKASNANPSCSVCTQSSHAFYGLNPEQFYEVHHTEPISEYESRQLTELDSLAVVCPNCHRAIHSVKPMPSIPEMRRRIDGGQELKLG